ncbi:MAG: membrane protein insertase YidC [Spirochaetaceae bacterium]|jgi:YidC/Oxa1 family membrane protein insertase|nr:membrane protein insertase YidC [Spirochaetaceae bacterium]
MEKQTVLAILLSTLVIFGWFLIQPKLFPPPQTPETEQAAGTGQAGPGGPAAGPAPAVTEASPGGVPAVESAAAESPAFPAGEFSAAGDPAVEAAPGDTDPADPGALPPPAAVPEKEERVVIDTELIRAVLTSQGGDMVSYQLKKHQDRGEMVQMILPVREEGGEFRESHAFTLAFGGLEARPLGSYFRVSQPSPLTVEFARDFTVTGFPGTFTLTKRYEFKPGEYMFQLAVSIDSPSAIPLNFNNAAYTLGFGPQIGPTFETLDQRYDPRHYYTLINGKRREEKVGEDNLKIIDSRFTWAGIAGKYFAAIAVPDSTLYGLAFSSKGEPGISAASRFYLIRPALDSARSKDVFHFYLGPKNQENMGRYDTGDNGFKLRELDFTKAASTSGFLSPLENLLKLLLQLFYRLKPNYGIAIILLTLLVKVVLFPLTKKSSEMSLKMQALAPKIKELQEKYRDNPAKLNAEMGALYKREGHNPMSGCLPLLIQMPILFAMYNLFNTHFDLRGAMFLPGWIPDLSLPESVWNFAHPIPLLNWTALRLLPFIYLGSQLLYGFATRTPDQQGNPSMKMFMYAMPIMFFFILYNVPSGLLVFWIMSNLFTLVQQIILNKYLAGHRPVPAENEKPPVIAPRRKKRR